MFERDYLMKMVMDLVQALAKSMIQSDEEENPYAAARSLEVAIGNAVDMDAFLFLSLQPESMASMMSISSMDANGAEYISRSLALSSAYNRAAGDADLADLRLGQAKAVAEAYGLDASDLDAIAEGSIREANEAMQEFIDSEQDDA